MNVNIKERLKEEQANLAKQVHEKEEVMDLGILNMFAKEIFI